MAYLIDTSVLVRIADKFDRDHQLAAYALLSLHDRGEVLVITPQNLIEFRAVATRPSSANGLGMISEVVESYVDGFEANYVLADDNPTIYPAWKALVRRTGTLGKQVHDARLAAVCEVHGISHLPTFNVKHFARFAPALTVVDPGTI